MKYIDAVYEDIKDMLELNITRSYNTTGTIYWYHGMLLKRFALYLDGKIRQLENLEFLNNHELLVNDNEFMFSSKIVRIDNTEVGMLLPYFESKSLDEIFKDVTIPIDVKRNYLVKVGNLLERLDAYRMLDSDLKTFYIGDIHGGNFLFDNNGRMKLIDLDSCNVNGNKPFPILYNFFKDNLLDPVIKEKYPLYPDTTIITPSINSDLYCYTIMIVSSLFGFNAASYTADQFNAYLDYLFSIGFGEELLHCFGKIYTKDDNVNPVKYIDQIPDNYQDAHILKFMEYQRNIKTNVYM